MMLLGSSQFTDVLTSPTGFMCQGDRYPYDLRTNILKIRSLYIPLAILKLSVWTRMASNSQRST